MARALYKGKGMPIMCDGDDYIEYEIDFDNFIKLAKPPYDLWKRSEDDIWYMWLRKIERILNYLLSLKTSQSHGKKRS